MMNKKLLVHWEWQQLVAGLWKSAIDIHAIDKKRLSKGPVKNQPKIQLTSSQKEKEKESASVSEPVNQSSIMSFITKEETMKTEICWVFESLLSNCSFVSCSTKTELFTVMFSDSTIAKQFSMGKTKCACYLTYGMAPYFKDIFSRILKRFNFTLCLLMSDTIRFANRDK